MRSTRQQLGVGCGGVSGGRQVGCAGGRLSARPVTAAVPQLAAVAVPSLGVCAYGNGIGVANWRGWRRGCREGVVEAGCGVVDAVGCSMKCGVDAPTFATPPCWTTAACPEL
eukprot:scaffold116333_cov16-Tisochrysis_lutea.AAC.1